MITKISILDWWLFIFYKIIDTDCINFIGVYNNYLKGPPPFSFQAYTVGQSISACRCPLLHGAQVHRIPNRPCQHNGTAGFSLHPKMRDAKTKQKQYKHINENYQHCNILPPTIFRNHLSLPGTDCCLHLRLRSSFILIT